MNANAEIGLCEVLLYPPITAVYWDNFIYSYLQSSFLTVQGCRWLDEKRFPDRWSRGTKTLGTRVSQRSTCEACAVPDAIILQKQTSFLSPEAVILLVSIKYRDRWPAQQRKSAIHGLVKSVKNTKRVLCACSKNRFLDKGLDAWWIVGSGDENDLYSI